MKRYLTPFFLNLLFLLPCNAALAQMSLPSMPTIPLPGDKSIAEQKQEILKKNGEILSRLYAIVPSTKEAIPKAAGYATFSNFGMKILVAGGGSGAGVVIDNQSHKPIYMSMVEVQAGLGMGAKSFEIIFVFQNKTALNSFINSGWSMGGQATASAKYKEAGEAFQGAVDVAPGVLMYQLTGSGLAAEITAKGTKYYRNSELNK
jgi:lipid-binding SYLF domain-containing protein